MVLLFCINSVTKSCSHNNVHFGKNLPLNLNESLLLNITSGNSYLLVKPTAAKEETKLAVYC